MHAVQPLLGATSSHKVRVKELNEMYNRQHYQCQIFGEQKHFFCLLVTAR